MHEAFTLLWIHDKLKRDRWKPAILDVDWYGHISRVGNHLRASGKPPDVQPTQWIRLSWHHEWLIDDLTWIYPIIFSADFHFRPSSRRHALGTFTKTEVWYFLCFQSKKNVEIIELPVIWDTITMIKHASVKTLRHWVRTLLNWRNWDFRLGESLAPSIGPPDLVVAISTAKGQLFCLLLLIY